MCSYPLGDLDITLFNGLVGNTKMMKASSPEDFSDLIFGSVKDKNTVAVVKSPGAG